MTAKSKTKVVDMQKIWLLVAVCCCWQCDDPFVKSKIKIPPIPTGACPSVSFDEAAVFKTASIRKEVG